MAKELKKVREALKEITRSDECAKYIAKQALAELDAYEKRLESEELARKYDNR